VDSNLNRQLYDKYQDLCDRSCASGSPSPFKLDGFSACPNGWYNLIDEYIGVLSQFPDICLLQVKSKFGGLRVYFSGRVSDRASAILGNLEEKSYNTCETCGKPARTESVNYWTRTLCDEHHAEWKNSV